jgi:hypothetical protein
MLISCCMAKLRRDTVSNGTASYIIAIDLDRPMTRRAPLSATHGPLLIDEGTNPLYKYRWDFTLITHICVSPNSTVALTYDCRYRLRLVLLAFFHSKTKNPTHMSSPAAWWLCLKSGRCQHAGAHPSPSRYRRHAWQQKCDECTASRSGVRALECSWSRG